MEEPFERRYAQKQNLRHQTVATNAADCRLLLQDSDVRTPLTCNLSLLNRKRTKRQKSESSPNILEHTCSAERILMRGLRNETDVFCCVLCIGSLAVRGKARRDRGKG